MHFEGRIGGFLNSASFWVPILYFTILFVGLALILNRAGWAAFDTSRTKKPSSSVAR